jgi:uncharacterized protein (TIGR00304 family)
MDLSLLFTIGIILVVIGIIVIVVAIIFSLIGGTKKGKIQGAGVIIIGPIPIIFGTDKKSIKSILALTLALMIVILIILVIYYWLLR